MVCVTILNCSAVIFWWHEEILISDHVILLIGDIILFFGWILQVQGWGWVIGWKLTWPIGHMADAVASTEIRNPSTINSIAIKDAVRGSPPSHDCKHLWKVWSNSSLKKTEKITHNVCVSLSNRPANNKQKQTDNRQTHYVNQIFHQIYICSMSDSSQLSH